MFAYRLNQPNPGCFYSLEIADVEGLCQAITTC